MKHEPQRMDVRFQISWETDWHVGSGLGTSAVDRLIRRRACGPKGHRAAFVPGSQIKGVLRHQCERLVVMIGGEVVAPHMVGPGPPSALLDAFRPLGRSALLVDRLFGSRFQGDCLFVEDAIPPPLEGPPQRSWVHTRTAIDRVVGTAREHALFSTELAAANGPNLQSRLEARHPPGVLTQDNGGFPFEYALLLTGLLSIESLGGDKSAGRGRCRIAIEGNTVRWNDCPAFPVADALKSFEETEWMEMLQMIREENEG